MSIPRLLCFCALGLALVSGAFAQEAEIRASAEPSRVEEGAEVEVKLVEIDLHDASALTRRGCPPETALQILL